MPKPLQYQAILGFDFGMRRIGIAVGQMVTRTANPLAILNAKDGVPNWADIKTLIESWNIDALVVGIPYNMDGSVQPITHAAQKFAKKLRAQFDLPVYMVDERLTSIEAKHQTRSTEALDSYAAKLILEQWLHEQPT